MRVPVIFLAFDLPIRRGGLARRPCMSAARSCRVIHSIPGGSRFDTAGRSRAVVGDDRLARSNPGRGTEGS